MKTAVRCAIVSLSLVGLAACASVEHRAAQKAPQARAMTSEEMYIARVEQIARRRGIAVIWVNRPQFSRADALAQE